MPDTVGLPERGGRLARFLRKPAREKFAAVFATLTHALRLGRPLLPGEILATHRWAAPDAIRRGVPFYLALRPESEIEYGVLPELPALSEAWVHRNRVSNAGDLPRLYSLMMNIRAVLDAGVPGDLAELGVYRGNSAAVLAHYARAAGRELLLFDTFAGFDRRDFDGVDKNRIIEFDDTSLDAVRGFVGTDRTHFFPGRFPESVPTGLETARFSVVHLDCDLYAPIKAGMEFFFPRLSPGGLMIVHDYANPGWQGVKQAVDEVLAGRPERPILLPDKAGTAMIRKA